LNTLARGLLSFALPIGLGVLFLSYMGVRASAAKTRVEAFCSELSVGSPIAGVVERAGAAGLTAHDFPVKEGKGSIMLEDGLLLARHFCTVNHEQGLIVSKEKSFTD
jgi:hypothetical protein